MMPQGRERSDTVGKRRVNRWPSGEVPLQTVAVRPAAVEPVFGGSLVRDAKAAGKYFTAVEAVLQAQKAEEQHADEAALKSRARAVKEQFFRRHAAAIYDEVTDDGARFLRVSEVVAAASNRYPPPGRLHRRAAAQRQRQTSETHVARAVLGRLYATSQLKPRGTKL
jgi:hypothetical protein